MMMIGNFVTALIDNTFMIRILLIVFLFITITLSFPLPITVMFVNIVVVITTVLTHVVISCRSCYGTVP